MARNNKNKKLKNFFAGDDDYGFLKADQMPAGEYRDVYASLALREGFVTTGQTGDYLNNHCGATAATNFARHYIREDWRKIFVNVYALIGNGPAFFISHKIKRYFKSHGLKLKSKIHFKTDKIKKASIRNRLSILLLANGIFDWHYVLCLGYRAYANGDDYLIIADGWTRTVSYYKVNRGSLMFSATTYDLIIS